jgi:hypothetical protein
LLISLHLPKTAGASFLDSLENHFGDRLVRDYKDLPINTPAPVRKAGALGACFRNSLRAVPDVDCIHGHFLPLKYRLLARRRDVKFATWMRDPVERLASHYHFWKRTYKPGKAPALQRAVVEDDWSFERFALGPELRNIYAQFLWLFPLRRFDFIGITEHYERDFARFTRRFLGVAMSEQKINVNVEKRGRNYVEDASLRARIEAHHARDMNLYLAALNRNRSDIDKSQTDGLQVKGGVP